ncbi:MAG: hypothetical protein ACKV19_01180 [Verrucomicrobiales bacterium]
MKSLLLFLTVVGCIPLMRNSASACTTPPPDPPPTLWVINHLDGTAWIGIEVGKFLVPQTAVTCSCAIQLIPNFGFLPANVTGAKLALTNTRTHAMETILEFDNDPDFGSGIEALDGFAGFSVRVDPADFPNGFPQEGPDEKLKLWFDVDFDFDLGGSFRGTANFATGSPDDPAHLPQDNIFTAVDNRVSIPESTSGFFLLGMSTIALFGFRNFRR